MGVLDLFEDVIDERMQNNTKETRLSDIKNLMDSLKFSVEQAMDALKIPSEQRSVYEGLLQNQ